MDRASALKALPGDLHELAARALERNVFYEPLMFLPALRFIDVDVPLLIICVRTPSGKLAGMVPVVLAPLRAGLPPKVLRNWTHRYCFLGTPLLDATHAREALKAIEDWMASGAAPARGLQYTSVSWDGPFARLMRQALPRPQTWVRDVATADRALLERTADPQSPLSAKHAKELRRLARRLSEQGRIDYAQLQTKDDWRPWFDDFLSLEAGGWKGAAGSAIASKAQDVAFFREVVQTAHATGRLQMLRLTLAGQPIAMKLNIRAGDTTYCLKIAHDETWARYSPGVLLELYNIQAFAHEPAAIARMDSCAAEGHPMINRLWAGRREIAMVTLARQGVLLRAMVRLRPLARRFRQARLPLPETR